MGYPFGKDIIYTFYPLADDKTIYAIPTQGASLNIYIFGDNAQPSRDAAQNGTGKLAGTSAITTWEQIGKGFEFTIPAIVDPDPDGSLDRRTYWIAINFILQASGQVQTVIKALEMERALGHHKIITVSPQDVKNIFPQVTSYVSNEQIIGIIQVAIENLKSTLRNKGFEWAQIYRVDRLNIACLYNTLMQIMLSQRRQLGDNFDQNYREYKGNYENAMNALKIEYDSDRDGLADGKDVMAGGFVLNIR